MDSVNPLSVQVLQRSMDLFLDAIRSPVTRRYYLRRLGLFLQRINVDPETFARKAKDDTIYAEHAILEYLRTLRDRVERGELVGSSVRNYYKPIKLFLEMNDVSLNWKKVQRALPRERKYALDRAPNMEEIRAIMNDGDPRLKCAIPVMASSGIRIGAWEDLKWKHVKPVHDEAGSVVAAKLLVDEGDVEQYSTFVTPEAYLALQEYVKFRELHGEKITEESPLLRDEFGATAKGARGLASRPKLLNTAGLRHLIDRALWRAGMRKERKTRHEFQTAHGFRKFFKTRCEEVMRPINVELLMGHSLGLADSYYRSVDKLGQVPPFLYILAEIHPRFQDEYHLCYW